MLLAYRCHQLLLEQQPLMCSPMGQQLVARPPQRRAAAPRLMLRHQPPRHTHLDCRELGGLVRTNVSKYVCKYVSKYDSKYDSKCEACRELGGLARTATLTTGGCNPA